MTKYSDMYLVSLMSVVFFSKNSSATP